jgi:hypothetical protein
VGGGLNEFAKVDIKTGHLTALMNNVLSAPHGLVFIPSEDDDERE